MKQWQLFLILPVTYCVIWLCTIVDWSKVHSFLREPPMDTLPKKAGVIKVAFWTSWFGDPLWKNVLASEEESMPHCPYQCEFYTNVSDPLQYDVLVFHARDHQTRPRKRTPKQIYIMLMYESPINSEERYIKDRQFYNWSATYHHNSEVSLPYYSFKKKVWDNPADRHIPELPQRDKSYDRKAEAMVAWVVSNCLTNSRREEYARLLSNHIKVDIFGHCGKQCFRNRHFSGFACHTAIAQSGQYKFYLAFENSACRDYITEKPSRALQVGLVPIVYGGIEGKDYLTNLPPHSYIDVRDYPSPRQLAGYLIYLDTNNTAYREYHTWRLDYEFAKRNTRCSICTALHNSTLISRPRHVNWKTFWNPVSQCDIHLFDKVRGKEH